MTFTALRPQEKRKRENGLMLGFGSYQNVKIKAKAKTLKKKEFCQHKQRLNDSNEGEMISCNYVTQAQ